MCVEGEGKLKNVTKGQVRLTGFVSGSRGRLGAENEGLG